MISSVPLSEGWGEKHLLFVKWKLTEAKVYCFIYSSISKVGILMYWM